MSDVTAIQKTQRMLIPRQVQRLLKFQKQKRSTGRGPSDAKRQLAIREVLLWSLDTETVEDLSSGLLQSTQQAHLEETHHWFGWAVAFAETGELCGQVASAPLDIARQVLEFGDWSMNRKQPEIVRATLPPLSGCHDQIEVLRRAYR